MTIEAPHFTEVLNSPNLEEVNLCPEKVTEICRNSLPLKKPTGLN